ncbi:uncharacterized protein [Branchiostoma lanceolatum]|uniref:uncharacterized protein n=1 Tax=Branchiostoma lanceolatum TaxID=7740 RepID=UPI0034515E9D
MEVEMGGPEMRALYEQACKKGFTQVFSTRLILVGNHGNGKTSLEHSLLQLEFHEDEGSTDGIVITSCLMTGKEAWRITKGMKDSEFVHAAAMEMKKLKEEETQEPNVSSRTDEDGEPKRKRLKSDLHQTVPASNGRKRKPVTSTSSQPSASNQPSTSTRRAATQPEEYKRATQILLGKDDLSHVVGSKEHPAMSIWDYAGHDVYYSSHHVFYSHYAIYIVTLNLTKPLDNPLKPWPGSCAEALQLRTEADVIDYHLESIRAHTGPNKRTLLNDDQELDVKQHKGPHVIVVGTHKDQVQQTQIDEFFNNLKEHLSGKAIDSHVYDRYFAIDNTKRDPEDPELSQLRDFILKIAKQQNHMGRRIPIRWLELKSKLVEMEKQGRKYCSLQEVMEATDSSGLPEGVTPEENAATVLRFFHLCGDILFFNSPELLNFVVLDPQWFVDVQKTIITIPLFRDLEVKEKWRLLETTGMLEDSLIEHVWKKRQEELKCDLIKHKGELLTMMEQFDLVLECCTEREDETDTNTSSSRKPTYFVPSLLTAVKNKEKLYPKGVVKCSKPIFAVFDGKFCPVGVYHRLVIASMRRHNRRKPLAYASCARFITSKPKQTFVITKKDYYLKVELLSSEKEESASFSHGPGVRKGLDEDLREIINKWIPGLRYKWCLQCCCDSHKEKELDGDRFIPIISVSEWFMDGEVVCETYCPATTTIEDIGLGHWCQRPQKQSAAGQGSKVQQQEQSEADSMLRGRCDISGDTNRIEPHPKTLQPEAAGHSGITPDSIANGSGSKPAVLMISNEYGNSYEGVSTIHRQMAGFLASKGAIVYSAVLYATRADEENAAADGVKLICPTTFKGDTRKPSLNWLTCDHLSRYPNLPSNVGFIVGHVNITSRAARQIKEQRLPDAKLVQVTHVMPEETSHYQGDEMATRIEEECNSILDDLRHADVIFSIGPLMYDYYTHQTKQQQRQHHEFLPKPSDVFSKMQVIHVSTETRVVLSSGRIMGEESLKGYDIAAKAMHIVIDHLPNTKWRASGVSPEDFPKSKEIIQANVEKGKIHFTPLKYATAKKLSEEMQRADVVLMPSRAEPFGLVGLEAITAGVPVLVSDKSGLAWFLRSQDPEFDRLIVEISDDVDKAAQTLAKRIISILKNGSREFQAARNLKEKLLASNYWDASHSKFLEVFGL